MIKIKQTVIVEGKYDKIRLSSLLDAVIIQTDGFNIFKNKDKQELIRKLAEKNGLLILTDSDAAGFKIRSFIGGAVPSERVIHAYIPDILGKEKRKDSPSKEGTLGVEGMTTEVLRDVLTKAGVICEVDTEPRKTVSKIDLYEDGLIGGQDSHNKRSRLLNELQLPGRLSASSMLGVINSFLTFDEYKAAVESCKEKYGW